MAPGNESQKPAELQVEVKPQPVADPKTSEPIKAPETTPSAAKPAVEVTLPETKEDQEFGKKAEEKAKEYIKKVEALRKKFQSDGSLGKAKADVLTDRQVSRMESVVAQKKEQFRKLTSEMKSQRMAIMLNETEQDLDKIYFPYEKIIDYCRGLDVIDDAALVKLEAIMESMTKLRNNPAYEAMFLKILSKQPIKPEDYQKLATWLNPIELQKEIDSGNGQKVFESAQIGSIIGIMDQAQRLEFIKVLLTVKTPEENKQILEMFLTAGIVSNLQVTHLCEQGKIPEPQKSQLLLSINNGEANQKQQKYQQNLNQLTEVNKGRTGDNAFKKVAGPPGLMMLSALWGAAVALVNFRVDPKNALSNPWFLAGTAAAVGGTLGVAAITSPGGVNKIKDAVFATPEQKAAREAAQVAQINEEMEQPLRTNPHLSKFLQCEESLSGGPKKSGFSILRDIVTKQRSQGQVVRYNLNEIMAQSGPEQKAYLQKALGSEDTQNDKLETKLNVFMACCFHQQIWDDSKLKQYLTDFNKRQGITT